MHKSMVIFLVVCTIPLLWIAYGGIYLMLIRNQKKEEGNSNELIDMLEEDGWVKRTSPKGTDPSEQLPSIMEIEWQELCNKLSDLRLRISSHDEETIKNILKKY